MFGQSYVETKIANALTASWYMGGKTTLSALKSMGSPCPSKTKKEHHQLSRFVAWVDASNRVLSFGSRGVSHAKGARINKVLHGANFAIVTSTLKRFASVGVKKRWGWTGACSLFIMGVQ